MTARTIVLQQRPHYNSTVTTTIHQGLQPYLWHHRCTSPSQNDARIRLLQEQLTRQQNRNSNKPLVVSWKPLKLLCN